MNKPSLIVCIIMDIIGCLSYFIPTLGEFSDAIWAPISAYVFYKMFGGKTGKIGKNRRDFQAGAPQGRRIAHGQNRRAVHQSVHTV